MCKCTYITNVKSLKRGMFSVCLTKRRPQHTPMWGEYFFNDVCSLHVDDKANVIPIQTTILLFLKNNNMILLPISNVWFYIWVQLEVSCYTMGNWVYTSLKKIAYNSKVPEMDPMKIWQEGESAQKAKPAGGKNTIRATGLIG